MNKQIKRKSNIASWFTQTLVILIFGCGNPTSKDAILITQGFVVFNDPDNWFYIPSKSNHSKVCINDFRTDNLNIGLQFRPSIKENHQIFDIVDTIHIDENSGNSTMLAAVTLEYVINKQIYDKGVSNYFNFNLSDKNVEFQFKIIPFEIKNITPHFCLSKKPSDIEKCACSKKNDDPDNYLYKICNKLKSEGDNSSFPCKYSIKEIGVSIFEGKEVIKVELNCCSVGDVAYFDLLSKELIHFKHGYQ